MIEAAKSVEDLLEVIKRAVERLGKELKRIDEKIDPVIAEQEARFPQDGLYRANLELKQSYIEQGKMAALVEVFVSIEQIVASLLEQGVKQADAEAAEAAAKAAREKQLADAELEAAKIEADAEAAKKKADADAEAAKKKAEADIEAAKKKAEADADAAKAKAEADADAAKIKAAAIRAAAQAKAQADAEAAAAKKKADEKKAEQDAHKAIAAALAAAATAFKGSAKSILDVKAMKDDLKKEIKEKNPQPVPTADGPVIAGQ
jgi:membrane protein involved in colicin uptake